MKNLIKLNFLLLIAAGLLWSSCATTNVTSEAKYLGDWEYLVRDTPNGDVTGIITISKESDAFNGIIKSDMGDTPIDNLVIAEDKLSGTFELQGMTLDIIGDFKGNSFTGAIIVDYNEFPMEMTKK